MKENSKKSFYSNFIEEIQINRINQSRDIDFYLKKHGILKEYKDFLPTAVYILDLASQNFIYFSKEVQMLLGYTENEMVSQGHQGYIERIHPEDIKVFLDLVYHFFVGYTTSISKKRLENTRFVVNYRIQNSIGNFVHLLDKHIVVESDEQNRPILLLGICSDISNYKTDDRIIFSVMEYDQKNSLQFITSKIFPEKTVITKRQKEILLELKKGATSKEIANKFSLSIHTINAHRRNLLEKFNFKNTSELINYFASNGVLCLLQMLSLSETL